jgi:hypothetical protein
MPATVVVTMAELRPKMIYKPGSSLCFFSLVSQPLRLSCSLSLNSAKCLENYDGEIYRGLAY